MSADEEHESRSERRGLLVSALLVGGLVLGGGLGLPWACGMYATASSTNEAFFLERDDTLHRIVLVSTARSLGRGALRRVDVVAPESGARIGRRVLWGETCLPATPDKLWCQNEDEVELLDLETLARVSSWGDIVEKSPQLGGGAHGDLRVTHQGLAVVKTTDGRMWKIPPDTLAAREVESPGLVSFRRPSSPESSQSSHVTERGSLRFAGSPRQRLELHRGDDVVTVAGGETFLGPTILAPTLEAGFLAASRDHVDRYESRPILHAFSDAGDLLWSTQTPEKGFASYAHVTDSTLYVVISAPANLLLAIRLADGELLWTYEI